MHIGIVLPAVPGYSETFFRSKIVGLQSNGFQVTLFVGSPLGANTFICPVKVHPRLAKHPFIRLWQSFFIVVKVLIIAPKATLRLLQIASYNGFDFLGALESVVIGSAILPQKLDWLHFGFATTAIKRELVGKAIGAQVAVSFRGFDISVYPIKNKKCYNLLWKYLDKVHTISNNLLEVAYLEGLPRHIPVITITPAILVDDFYFERSSNRVTSQISILTVARLHWIKGLEYTLEALAILKKEGLQFSFEIAGDGVELERLTFAVHQLEIVKEVEFLGKVPHNQIKQLMRESEIYIQYSIQEGFCNSVLEAQASGMLCIVSDAEGLQENVLDGKTGWVVPKRNPQALAAKILEVLSLTEIEKQSIKESARLRVETEFNLEKQRNQFVEFYSIISEVNT
jgi:colanic acid/amylovoran biosynthesis glycosyltransferase